MMYSIPPSLFAGLGLMSEAYLILALPIISLFVNENLTYNVPICMIAGMVVLGFAGLVYRGTSNRRCLSALTLALMASSVVSLLASPTSPLTSVNIFAFSVGGEYAISSAFIGVAENEDKAARGFVMQSVGAFLAALVMFFSFLCEPDNVLTVFRATVAISACLVLLVYSLRVRNYTALHLSEEASAAAAALSLQPATSEPKAVLSLVLTGSSGLYITSTVSPPTEGVPSSKSMFSRWAKFKSKSNSFPLSKSLPLASAKSRANENENYQELKDDDDKDDDEEIIIIASSSSSFSTKATTPAAPPPDLSPSYLQHLKTYPHFFFVEAHTWPRPNHIVVLSASVSWFLWDIIFYSTKLSQDTLIAEVTGSSDVATAINMSLAITAVSLAGSLCSVQAVAYYGAGKCQLVASVLVTALLTLLKFYSSNTSAGVSLFLALTFVGQVINTTTFVLPAVHLTSEFKTMGQGIAAASGKLGAVIGVRVFQDGGHGWDELVFAGIALILISHFLPIN
ncbi:hypothetical protein TrST_g1714 [Triparma strigata]|uniref:Major facilitator superfamily (MFS) profile domain-containing protein n=1 Tax=Triparma strigata TaxID=1606541 RepID=A0A9W7BPQ8_9STRA|nr:hypothetical protein TrST_g1714 [Triparma strigata]